MTKNTYPDDYSYFGYGFEFDALAEFSFSDSNGFDKNVIIFGVNMNSSVHINNKKNNILILGNGLTYRLDKTALFGSPVLSPVLCWIFYKFHRLTE